MGATSTTKATKSSVAPMSQPPQVDLIGKNDHACLTSNQVPLLQSAAMAADVTAICKGYNNSPPPESHPQCIIEVPKDGAYMHAIYMVCNIQSLIQNEQRLQVKITSQYDLQNSWDAVTKLLHNAQKWVAVLDLLESQEMVAHHIECPIV
ncbi:hypothetical protein CPB97_003319, partial [Podila verticillata]